MSDIQRKLATVREITEIRPIVGADAIECAVIDGWQVVVKKGEFNTGAKCVYFEIDSFLPVAPDYEFLRKSSFKSTAHLGDGFRLRTIKLRGQISQGLALPFTGNDNVGTDLTEKLGVKKWELPEANQPNVAGMKSGSRSFPHFLRKTDQERIQNYFSYLQTRVDPNTQFEATLKLDGSSMTVWYRDGEVGVCSRNLALPERLRSPWLSAVRGFGVKLGYSPERLDLFEEWLDALKCRIFGGRPGLVKQQSTFWETARRQGLIEYLQKRGENIALQGELMGPGIQGNREELTEHRFFLFDIWDIDRQRYWHPDERMEFIGNFAVPFPCDHVPFLGVIKLSDFASVEDFLKFAKRRSITHPIAEGVVFKDLESQLSFKAINNEFLLKEKD